METELDILTEAARRYIRAHAGVVVRMQSADLAEEYHDAAKALEQLVGAEQPQEL